MEVRRNMVTLSRASQDHDSLLCWGNPHCRCQNLVTVSNLLCWFGWTVKKQRDDPCVGLIPSRPTKPSSSSNIYGMNSSQSFYLNIKPTRPLLNSKHKGSRAGFVAVSQRWPRPLLLSCSWTSPDPFRSLWVTRRDPGTRTRRGCRAATVRASCRAHGETESLEQEIQKRFLWRMQNWPHYSVKCPCTCVYWHSG